MFWKLYKNSPVKNILVFSLSNIGDVILTCPVIDILLKDFPSARLTVLVGPKAQTLFIGNPRVETMVFDKHLPWGKQWRGIIAQGFDLVVDLRQTALGLFLPCRWRTPLIPQPFKGHLRLKHIQRLKALYPGLVVSQERLAIVPKPVSGAQGLSSYVVLAPGAADSAKRWPASSFARLADALVDRGQHIVFTAGAQEQGLVEGIQRGMRHPSLSLAGKVDLCELAFILKNAQLAVTHDSGAMHLASYFDVPVLGLFGPTDPQYSSPWSSKSAFVRRHQDCPRCKDVNALTVPHACMEAITVEDVLNAIDKM